MERLRIVIDPREPSCKELCSYFAQVFVSLDERPRPLLVSLDVRNELGKRFTMDFNEGEVVFASGILESARTTLRNRYLPEHPMPISLPIDGTAKFVFTPTSGNRVKVRKANFIERVFA